MDKTRQQYDEYLLAVASKGTEPLVIVKGQGRTVTDAAGKTYLDCFAGISVVNAGHNHPRIIAAAKEQMEKLVHCCSYVYAVPAVGQLAETLAGLTPGDLKKSFFGNSGAEANEGAMRLAKQATGKHEFVALTFSFHGRTAGTLSVTGNCGRKKNGGPYLSGVAFAPAPYCYRCPFKQQYPGCGMACAHAVRDTIKQQTANDVAGFIGEAVMGEGGIIAPPAEYYKTVTQIIHEHGGLLIADEVQCGFGRTGKWFAIEHSDVVPDIMTMAKGIASGFPLSAFITRPQYGDVMQPGDHLSTFGGNPVSCAAALANIAVMKDEKLVENAAVRGEQLMVALREMQNSCSMIGDVRGRGLMIGVELVRDRKTKDPADKETKAARAALREKGVLVGSGGVFANVLRIQPPLSITADEVQQLVAALKAVLK